VFRILPFVIVGLAIWMHLTFCEWDFRRGSVRNVSQAQYARTIYHHAKTSGSRHVFLLAKPPHSREDATLYGAVFPALLIGGGLWMLQLQGRGGTSRGTAASIGTAGDAYVRDH